MFVGLDSIALLQAYLAIGIPGSAGLATPGIAVAEAVLTAVDLFVIGAATFTILKGCVFGI